MNPPSLSDAMIETLQRDTFAYVLDQANPATGLVSDTTAEGAPASIAVVAFALAAYPVGVERGFWPCAEAVARTLTTLRFFWNSPQGTEPDATGYQGFYSPRPISTGKAEDEAEIRALGAALYRQVDWRWRPSWVLSALQ